MESAYLLYKHMVYRWAGHIHYESQSLSWECSELEGLFMDVL